ncbi:MULTISPECIES: ROK family protein [Ensifer]|uniref:ROK family protein n=1 Tax=Ensifer TaxID=106591 RepID=UPI000DE3D07C|nr:MULTISPECIES: ROK family protein [Ensifer]MBD9558387.1 ROK family protein [Ensifer sp. ENS03]MBW0367406.1 ROK family protein [Ensifer adhaerens]UCM19349.1 ROK family protein [Ensifer adhaerens]
MFIGIDWGGTKMEVIALGRDGETRARHRVSTPTSGYDDCIRAVLDLVAAAEQTAGEQGSIGIGIPGSPNPRTGIVRNSNAVLINGKPLGRDLETALGRPVRLANDANCLAVSEAVDGAGKNEHVVFGVIVGTGHGGGLAIDKKVHAGYQGVAAEIGHYPLPWMTQDEYPGHKCWCGKHGCLDMYACGTGVELDYRLTTGGEKRGRDIIEAKRAGDSVATGVYERFVDRLARSLALLTNIVDPDVYVLGGGMSNVDEIYQDVPPRVVNYLFGDTFETPIRKALHGDSSGVRGAAWLWKE